MKKRGYLELPFSWVFALIVGAFILFIAILLIVRITKTETSSQDIQGQRSFNQGVPRCRKRYECK